MSPLETIQNQVIAYNSRDIDAFAACHHENVELYTLGENEAFCIGGVALHKRYAEVFGSSPDLHTEIINRIVCGNTVIDHELVTGRVGEDAIEMFAIYEVEEGKISKAYFRRK